MAQFQAISALSWLAWVFVLILLSFLFIRRFTSLGTKAKQVDIGSRWSKQTKPTIGGIIFLIALLPGGIASFWDGPNHSVLLISTCAGLAFLLGLWDDLKRIPASSKLGGQMLITAVFVTGLLLLQEDSLSLSLFLALALAFVVVVGMMNSVNMLDNMDGISSISALPVIYLTLQTSGELSLLVYSLLAGILAFLFFNRSPSKIFMGDSGSMFLGFFLASTLILSTPSSPGNKLFILQLIVFLVSSATLYLADSTVVVINRLRHGISPAQGGRDHTTHNLVYLGLSDARVALVFLALALIQMAWIKWMLNQEMYSLRDWIKIASPLFAYFFLLTTALFLISLRNLRKGKYSYKR